MGGPVRTSPRHLAEDPTFGVRLVKDAADYLALVDPGKIYGGISGIGHFVVIVGRMKNKVVYHDPVMGQNLVTEEEIFFQAWQEFNFRGVRIWKSTER